MKYPQLVSMPSAISDWLEEQLEARGIDAVVYTRYILSLLHSDTVDVIYSDEDLQFSHLKKEVRRSGGSRKRFRRSSDWWRHAQADAEKLKRSAAVECLMSAAEQTCGIESLIDELCEKLNEIKSDAHVDPPTKKANPEFQHVSPQELAKRYYAAFPPLNPNNSSNSPAKLISLIPKWVPSPKKKNSSHSKPNNNETMKTNRTMNKQRYGLYFTGRSNNKKEKDSAVKKSRTENAPKTCNAVQRLEKDSDWSCDEDANMYDDLPVDIKELLDDSPTSHDATVEMMNLANMRDTGRRGFIPCGTNITSSIWTNDAVMEDKATLFDNAFNSAIVLSDSVLDLQFSSITINNNNNKTEWGSSSDLAYGRENERNAFFDDQRKWELPSGGGKWSDDSGCFDDDQTLNQISLSLGKLNHNKDASAFAEVAPKNRCSHHYNLFSKVIGSGLHRDTSLLKTVDLDNKDKDDLLTSVRSHFRPINEKVENLLQSKYADGATFVVSNAWDKINYRRTESGAMYMENDHNMRKKYCEYKSKNGPSDVDFVLKYLVCQNDKGCQTDDLDAEVEAINLDSHVSDQRDDTASCDLCDCPADASEDMWQQQPCDKCNNNLWSSNVDDSSDLGWQFGTMSKIWSGGVVCHACLGRPPSTLQHSKLREDVSQDGDQLLSDLSTLQKNYMQENLPLTEFTCDLSDFLMPKERKRRHSLMAATDSWSFASRLEEDCLIQMSTIPTLRSVTL